MLPVFNPLRPLVEFWRRRQSLSRNWREVDGVIVARAHRALRAGQVDLASWILAECDPLPPCHPRNIDAHQFNALALIAESHNAPDTARDLWVRSLHCDPRNTLAFENLCRFYEVAMTDE